MHDEYKRLLRNPEQYSAYHIFDDVLSLTRMFHLIEPSIVSKSENDDVALTNFLGILGACILGPISINSLKGRMGNEGLTISCHCHTYLANAWCKYACAFAFDRGIISTFPKTMHPKPTSIKNKDSGRIKHAKCGSNFDFKRCLYNRTDRFYLIIV